jgi:hypothetical protein
MRRRLPTIVRQFALVAITALPACARAQVMDTWRTDLARNVKRDSAGVVAAGAPSDRSSTIVSVVRKPVFSSTRDSLEWARYKAIAARAKGYRVVVSLQDRMVFAIAGDDTVLRAVAAVAKGNTLEYGNKKWKFDTPRGPRTVLSKEADPIWQPPDWLYAETALEHDLVLGPTITRRGIKLKDGRTLTVRDSVVGLIGTDGLFAAMPIDEHIVFYDTLYIPPLGTKNRKIDGELGKYRLNLGEGYLLHGTPHKTTIGLADTHGCIRLADEDIQWLYENVPVGTKVYIY